MSTPESAAASMIANLKKNTGKTLAQWTKIARAVQLQKHGQIVKHLKAHHGLTHGFANLIAHKALASDAGSQAQAGVDIVAAQYTGAKADLKPIYEALIAALNKLGRDVEVAPKKNYVSIRRNKQFALIQPSTKTRVDVGINLKDTKATDRLEVSGSFNTMVSHRVRLSRTSEVDKELKEWLKKAYQSA